jgi:predicted kinase
MIMNDILRGLLADFFCFLKKIAAKRLQGKAFAWDATGARPGSRAELAFAALRALPVYCFP